MTEYLLTTDNFSRPAFFDGPNAFAVILMRLFLLQPGTNPLHPGMGIGLAPTYRFITEDDMDALTNLISNQIHTYLPAEFAASAEVHLKIKPDKYLLITIISDGNKYIFDTEDSEAPVQLSETLS